MIEENETPPVNPFVRPAAIGERAVGLFPLNGPIGQLFTLPLPKNASVLGIETTVTTVENKIATPGEQAGPRSVELIALVIEASNVPECDARTFLILPAGARTPYEHGGVPAQYLGCAMVMNRTQAFFVYELFNTSH